MNKKRIVLGYKAFPFAIASYFRHALEKRPDVELFTVGEYFGDFIPWNGGMRLPLRYVKTVDLPLPRGIAFPRWETVREKLPWKPDLALCVDAGFYFSTKPDCPYVVVGTDPHVLNYDRQRNIANQFFNMQRAYMKQGDHHLPYACSPDHHYAMSSVEKEYDACLIGLHYEQRNQLVAKLRDSGYKVKYELGLVYDEYRTENNKARIGLNWSSLQDINARTFEIMAMRLIPVINRLPHLDELGLIEGKHYLGFDSADEAVEKVKWALDNPEFAEAVALAAYQLVHDRHTYDKRIEQIFETVGLG